MTERVQDGSLLYLDNQRVFRQQAIDAGADRLASYMPLQGLPWGVVLQMLESYCEIQEGNVLKVAEQFGVSIDDATLTIKRGLRELWHNSPISIREAFPIVGFKVDKTPLGEVRHSTSFSSFETQQSFYIEAIAARVDKKPLLLDTYGVPWETLGEILRAYYMTPAQIPELADRFHLSPNDITISIRRGVRSLYHNSPLKMRKVYDIRHFRLDYSPLAKPEYKYPFEVVPPIETVPATDSPVLEPEKTATETEEVSDSEDTTPKDDSDIALEKEFWNYFVNQGMERRAKVRKLMTQEEIRECKDYFDGNITSLSASTLNSLSKCVAILFDPSLEKPPTRK